ncbi:MAG TPA: MarR family transcriptional regulator [Longimicrobium sp.]|jgi:DNA-binding MarR family transcriptional regulator
MAGRIQEELKQSKPIDSLEEEIFLNLARTYEALSAEIAELLRRHDLRPTQYNVLRILRGAGESGLTAGEIAERMITRDPDVTRLIDRLEKRGLVERWRCTHDRRVVWTRISPDGLEMIAPLDESMRELHVRQLAHLGPERLATLRDLLEEARAGIGG